MPFTKGNAPAGGRKRGSKNRVTQDLRVMIKKALEEAGGVEYLLTCARENPQSFLALVGKTLPKDVVVQQTVRAYVVAPAQAESMEAWHQQVTQAASTQVN